MDVIRTLNEEGVKKFSDYLDRLTSDPEASPPLNLLKDGEFSEPFDTRVSIEAQSFGDAYEFGEYLSQVLEPANTSAISLDSGLWSWLALYYFDFLCPRDDLGRRRPLEKSSYVLDSDFKFRRYYRHAVRTPWLAVQLHGEKAKVLLITSGKGRRTDIAEQLGAYQEIFASKTIIKAAYNMYYDNEKGMLKRGAGGKGPGSPRRLSAIVRQLQLTYDLYDCSVPNFMSMLPSEFGRWAK